MWVIDRFFDVENCAILRYFEGFEMKKKFWKK
jgi:hypothetical protein